MSSIEALKLASEEAESNISIAYAATPHERLITLSKLGNLHVDAYGAVEAIELSYNSATSVHQTDNNKIVAITWYCDDRLVITTGERVSGINQITVRNYDKDLQHYCCPASIRYVAVETPSEFIRAFLG